MKLVIMESPHKGRGYEETEENIRFARLCVRDSILRGEAPYASHLLYTQGHVLDDKIPEERMFGIEAGFAWKTVADLTVVYINRGISHGMHFGIRKSVGLGQKFEYRVLPGYPSQLIKPLICTITGASGVGKTTLLKSILVTMPNARLVPSYTSRSSRPSDLPDEYIYDVSGEEFDRRKRDFLWVFEAHGNFYGTLRDDVLGLFASGSNQTCPRFMILTPEAAMILHGILGQFKNKDYNSRVVSFFSLSPGEDELHRRLVARGDSEDPARQRVFDCCVWDSLALESSTPYIFLKGRGLATVAENIEQQLQQVSLFL